MKALVKPNRPIAVQFTVNDLIDPEDVHRVHTEAAKRFLLHLALTFSATAVSSAIIVNRGFTRAGILMFLLTLIILTAGLMVSFFCFTEGYKLPKALLTDPMADPLRWKELNSKEWQVKIARDIKGQEGNVRILSPEMTREIVNAYKASKVSTASKQSQDNAEWINSIINTSAA